jgi:hypothetical protein
MMEAIRSSKTSVFTRATWRHIPEDGILHCHRRENLKSYRVGLFANTEVSEEYTVAIFRDEKNYAV